MSKLVNYLRYLQGGISRRNGDALRFIAEEIKTKSQRLRNQGIRRRFDAASSFEYVQYPSPATLHTVRVFSLCHAGGTPEQKLCLLSFLRYVGAPAKWTIVSDGSIAEAQAQSLMSLHPCIEVVDWTTFLCDENRDYCLKFLPYTMFAKKLALESNLPVQGVSVYTDADILFFAGASELRDLLNNAGGRSFYQQDLPGYLDVKFLTDTESRAPPLNAGFVVQGKVLDWSAALKRLDAELERLTPEQKSFDLEKLEQATVHMAHLSAGSEPLNHRYALQISDRLDDQDVFSGPNYVMRHYVRPVRHKMWKHATEYLG